VKKYLIASHGKFASGLKNTIQILTGIQQNITTVDVYIDKNSNIDFLDKKIKNFVASVGQNDYGIIFTDLTGGSVNREIMEKVGNKKNFYIISSINLPIVLSILLDKDIPTESNLKELIDKSQVRLMEFPTKLSLESDDSFLS
jgi:mannose/fructose-specific phosphotransferase system component IIA